MPKGTKQKLKLIYIIKYLMENTDENHKVTMADIIRYLESYDITAERKSIYADLETLRDIGIDVLGEKVGRNFYYYIAGRDFEVAELKLLVDAVQASKFITSKKSRELIGKLETLCSKKEAGQLHRQVVVTNRAKAVNENIYYNVDQIYAAIAENVKIQFLYFDWNVKKEMVPRHDGKYYTVSPWLLTWDDDNYYLIAYDDESNMIKHYRVDKMLNISLAEQSRQGKEVFENFDIAGYSRKTFGMFAGEEETVILLCDRKMTGVFIDRFGNDVSMRNFDEEHILVRVNVAVSRQFFGWLTGLGSTVKIQSPEKTVKEYTEYLQNILANY